MATGIERPLKGSRISTFYPVKSVPPLSSLDSAFQLQEYISLLIRADVHDVETIVSVPGGRPNKEREGSDDSTGSDGDSEKDVRIDVNVDEACWIYEQLRRLAQDLSHPLITMLQQECTRLTCPEMKAGEWLYLCVAHGNDGSTEQCCAIDYILHTLDSATALLNSPRAFPSRLQIPVQSHRHFPSLARRLGRIFAHAFFHHREAFEQAEAESSLYARFLALTSKYELVPPEFLVIPPRLTSMSDDGRSMGHPTNLLDSHTYLKPDSQNGSRYDFGDSESVVDLSLSDEDRGPSPIGIRGLRGVSPRRSRNRTGTMVHSEALNAAEELSRVTDDATLSRHKASEAARAITVALAEANAQDQADAVLPPDEQELTKETPQPVTEVESEAVEIKVEEPSPSIAEVPLEEPPAVVETLEIAAPPPAEPGVPLADEAGEDITEASLDEQSAAIEEPEPEPSAQEDTKVPESAPEPSSDDVKPEPVPTPSEDVETVSEAEPNEPTESEPEVPVISEVEEEAEIVEVETEAKLEPPPVPVTEDAPSDEKSASIAAPDIAEEPKKEES